MNTIYGWALYLTSFGTGPQTQIQIRLQKARRLNQYQYCYVETESFTPLPTAIG